MKQPTIGKNEALNELMNKIGNFTKHQIWLFCLMSIVCIISGQLVVQILFISKDIPHRCKIPACDTENSSFTGEFLNFTTPYDEKSMTWDKCHYYSSASESKCERSNFNTSQISKCSEWVYDTSVIGSTTVSEFDIVCDDEWKQPLPNSCVMVGLLLGGLPFGIMADKLGRRSALLISILISGLGQAIGAVVFDFYSFLGSRVLLGFGGSAMFQLPFLLLLEQSSVKWKTFYGLIIETPFPIGEAAVAIFAYYTTSWRTLQGILAAITFCSIPLVYWLVPESIRWLVTKNKAKEAKKVIEKITKFNGTGEEHAQKFISAMMNNKLEEEIVINKEKELTFRELFTYPNIRRRFIKLCYIWFAVNLCYYGLGANSVNLGGDVFINFVAIMLIEIPAYIFGYLISERCGMKASLIFVTMFGGISCIASGTISQESVLLITSLSMAGKFGVSAGFAIVYLYTAELFSTPMRAICVGACNTSGRIGAVLAPFVSYLATFYRPLPLLIFGILSILSGILIFFMPETKGIELPQTIEESENFGKNQTVLTFSCCLKPQKIEHDESTRI